MLPKAVLSRLGDEPFDLVICCHVLEHTAAANQAARNIERILKPDGIAYVATPWSQAFHAAPDDYWRFSVRGLMLMFERLDIVSAFYSGGDVGLDVAYRVVRDGKPDPSRRRPAWSRACSARARPRDNRAVLARQATERLPVSHTYLPANAVRQHRRPAQALTSAGSRASQPATITRRAECPWSTTTKRAALPALPDDDSGLRLKRRSMPDRMT